MVLIDFIHKFWCEKYCNVPYRKVSYRNVWKHFSYISRIGSRTCATSNMELFVMKVYCYNDPNVYSVGLGNLFGCDWKSADIL